MFNVGGGELLVIMLVALIVLGPQRLPGAARQIGRVMADIRRVSSGFQQELKDAFEAEGDDTPSRRAEPVPLAKAVAEADVDDTTGGSTHDAAEDTSSRAEGTPALREVPAAGDTAGGPDAGPDDASDGPAAGATGGVAPVVAEALDAIVPTSPGTQDGRGADGPSDAATPAADGVDTPGSEDGGDAGDERAAS